MRRFALLALCALASAGFRTQAPPAAFYLAGEPLRFDASMHPDFTARQTRGTDDATRAGITRWAATEHGRAMINKFTSREFHVEIAEDVEQESPGRAPQPALGTLVAASNHDVVKSYAVFLNPRFGVQRVDAVPGFPASPADVMSLAVAGEMLHVSFYARGISLPHHEREDFQREWRQLAAELGYPSVPHGIENETPRERATIVTW